MRANVLLLLKAIFTCLLIPPVVATTVSFSQALKLLPEEWNYFVAGIVVYLVVHIFLCEPQGIYQFGHKLVADIFQFFAPLVRVAPFVLPIYTLLLLISLYFVGLIWPDGAVRFYFMFLIGFTLAMHLVFTAKKLRDGDTNAAKLNYFFSICLIYVVNAFLMALLLDLVTTHYSFPNFFRAMTGITAEMYQGMFRQLF